MLNAPNPMLNAPIPWLSGCIFDEGGLHRLGRAWVPVHERFEAPVAHHMVQHPQKNLVARWQAACMIDGFCPNMWLAGGVKTSPVPFHPPVIGLMLVKLQMSQIHVKTWGGSFEPLDAKRLMQTYVAT